MDNNDSDMDGSMVREVNFSTVNSPPASPVCLYYSIKPLMLSELITQSHKYLNIYIYI